MPQPSSTPRAGREPFTRFLPFLSWVRHYRPSWLRRDLIAALTVTALLIPEGMAYAELAGLPPQTAFYAAPAALVLYALLGSSRQLIVAVSATVAVLSAATVGALAPAHSARYALLTAALAMLAGAISLLAGVLRLGRLAQFFSESVLTGFVFGLALVIAIKQVPKLIGLEAAKGNFFERLWQLVTHLRDVQVTTLLVGAGSLLMLVLLERLSHRIPAALVVLVLGTVAGAVLGLGARGVRVVGNIPAGLVGPALPAVGLRDVLALLPGACGIALVAFAEAIGPARMLAARHRYDVNPNQELIGLGAANLGAGLFRGFSIGCSLSKSAANDAVGARSEMSAVLAAGFTLLVALFFTPLFRTLPEATLAAIVVVAISGMMDLAEMRRLYRLRRADFTVAAAALLGVLVFDVLPGLLLAVGLSLVLLVYRASIPRLSELGRTPGTLDFADVHNQPAPLTLPGLLVLRPNEGLFFANATAIRDQIMARVRQPSASPLRAVLLDLEATVDLDVPGADMLAELHDELEHEEVTLLLSRVISPTRRMLEKTGVERKIGPEHIYPQTLNGVVDYLISRAPHSRDEWGLIRDGLHRLHQVVEQAAPVLHEEDRRQLEELRRRLLQVETELEEPGPPH